MSEWVCAIIWIEGTLWRIPQSRAGSNPSRRHLAPTGPLPACAPRIASCSSGSIPGLPHPIIVVRSGGTDLKTTSATIARPSGLPKRDDELLTRHRYHKVLRPTLFECREEKSLRKGHGDHREKTPVCADRGHGPLFVYLHFSAC